MFFICVTLSQNSLQISQPRSTSEVRPPLPALPAEADVDLTVVESSFSPLVLASQHSGLSDLGSSTFPTYHQHRKLCNYPQKAVQVLPKFPPVESFRENLNRLMAIVVGDRIKDKEETKIVEPEKDAVE